MSAAIECRGLWKSYRIYHQRSHSLKELILSRRNLYTEFLALKDIDFEVAPGSTLGIIGSNGSGKSTLLKVIARILTPNSGYVRTNGTMSSLLELGTGFHPELTGRENVFLAGSLLGLRKRDIQQRYDEIVAFSGIEEFMDLPVKNYSSGMYARLAFAVAISVQPDILLIDEVLAVGDESFQMRCYERISQLRSHGGTIVLVSHSLDAIRSLCQEAIWIEHGEIQARGKSPDVVARYLEDVHSGAQHQAGARGSRWGSMEAEIADVTFLGSGDEARSIFRTCDPFLMRIRYRLNSTLEDVSCGVAIYRADDLALLYTQNTTAAGLPPLRLSKEGAIDFLIPEMPMLKGTYLVSVALHDTPMKRVYDWHERRYSFLVFENGSLAREGGAIHIDGRWSIDAPVSA